MRIGRQVGPGSEGDQGGSELKLLSITKHTPTPGPAHSSLQGTVMPRFQGSEVPCSSGVISTTQLCCTPLSL